MCTVWQEREDFLEWFLVLGVVRIVSVQNASGAHKSSSQDDDDPSGTYTSLMMAMEGLVALDKFHLKICSYIVALCLAFKLCK